MIEVAFGELLTLNLIMFVTAVGILAYFVVKAWRVK